MDDETKVLIFWVVFGLLMGMFTGLLIMVIISPIRLSQETGNDICQQITGNENTISSSGDPINKLTCKTSSFDETQNIIIKQNDE